MQKYLTYMHVDIGNGHCVEEGAGFRSFKLPTKLGLRDMYAMCALAQEHMSFREILFYM